MGIQLMTGDSQPDEKKAITKRDWAKAALFIAVIVALVILFFLVGIGQLSGCGAGYGC
jgi:hypothetical protein